MSYVLYHSYGHMFGHISALLFKMSNLLLYFSLWLPVRPLRKYLSIFWKPIRSIKHPREKNGSSVVQIWDNFMDFLKKTRISVYFYIIHTVYSLFVFIGPSMQNEIDFDIKLLFLPLLNEHLGILQWLILEKKHPITFWKYLILLFFTSRQ